MWDAIILAFFKIIIAISFYFVALCMLVNGFVVLFEQSRNSLIEHRLFQSHNRAHFWYTLWFVFTRGPMTERIFMVGCSLGIWLVSHILSEWLILLKDFTKVMGKLM